MNFYNCFLPHATLLMHPLYEALQGEQKKREELDCSSLMEDAFKAANTAQASAALLGCPSATATIALTTDASDYTVRAVCEQWVGGAWLPLAFLASSSRTMNAITAPSPGSYLVFSSPPGTSSCKAAGSQLSWTTSH